MESEGVLGFWRGNLLLIAQKCAFSWVDSSITRHLPWMLKFLRQGTGLSRDGFVFSAFRAMGNLSMRTFLNTVLFFPLDVIRTRLQADCGPKHRYSGVVDAVQDCNVHLYSGFWSSVLSCCVYTITYNLVFVVLPIPKDQNFWIRHLARNYISTALAKTVAYPFLTVSRRQMVAVKGKYRTDFDAFFKIVEAEGVTTLWRGFGLNFIGTLLATLASLSFTAQVNQE